MIYNPNLLFNKFVSVYLWKNASQTLQQKLDKGRGDSMILTVKTKRGDSMIWDFSKERFNDLGFRSLSRRRIHRWQQDLRQVDHPNDCHQ